MINLQIYILRNTKLYLSAGASRLRPPILNPASWAKSQVSM